MASTVELIELPYAHNAGAIEGLAPTNSTAGRADLQDPQMSMLRRSSTIAALSGITAINALCSGLLTVALPRIAQDINLNHSLLLWPASVFGLAAGCTLLIFGAIADIIGSKRIWLVGIGLYTAFTLGCGFVETGVQIIIFRVLTGQYWEPGRLC